MTARSQVEYPSRQNVTADGSPHKLCFIEVQYDEFPVNQYVEREQSIAISDLLGSNYFEVLQHRGGPYRLTLSTRGSRLALHITTWDHISVVSHVLSFTPLRRVIRDYLIVFEAHVRAAVESDPYRLETVDMARRAIHTEGSELLRERLSAKVKIDQDTARRLFTLIVVPFTVGLSQ